MLFPMCIALGADPFDSAAYVLFARDDRLLTPEGTVRLKGIEHWPATTEVVNGRTVAEVRALPKADRERLLSLVNLEWTMAELERCRQAVRDGTIWGHGCDDAVTSIPTSVQLGASWRIWSLDESTNLDGKSRGGGCSMRNLGVDRVVSDGGVRIRPSTR